MTKFVLQWMRPVRQLCDLYTECEVGLHSHCNIYAKDDVHLARGIVVDWREVVGLQIYFESVPGSIYRLNTGIGVRKRGVKDDSEDFGLSY